MIEMIVVIVIISFLVTILSNAVVSGKNKIKSIKCKSSLRQWGQATFLFTMDNEGWLPKDGASNGASTKGGWYVSLPPYLNLPVYKNWQGRTNSIHRPPASPYLCPGNPKLSDGVNLFHYSLNRHVNGSGVGNRVRLTSISFPTRIIWFFDNGKRAAVSSASNLHTNIHQSTPNILCLDGHVEGKKTSDLVIPTKSKDKNILSPQVKGMDWIP